MLKYPEEDGEDGVHLGYGEEDGEQGPNMVDPAVREERRLLVRQLLDYSGSKPVYVL